MRLKYTTQILYNNLAENLGKMIYLRDYAIEPIIVGSTTYDCVYYDAENTVVLKNKKLCLRIYRRRETALTLPIRIIEAVP